MFLSTQNLLRATIYLCIYTYKKSNNKTWVYYCWAFCIIVPYYYYCTVGGGGLAQKTRSASGADCLH